MNLKIFVQGGVESAMEFEQRIDDWLNGKHPSGRGWIEVEMIDSCCASDGRLTICIWFERGMRKESTGPR